MPEKLSALDVYVNWWLQVSLFSLFRGKIVKMLQKALSAYVFPYQCCILLPSFVGTHFAYNLNLADENITSLAEVMKPNQHDSFMPLEHMRSLMEHCCCKERTPSPPWTPSHQRVRYDSPDSSLSCARRPPTWPTQRVDTVSSTIEGLRVYTTPSAPLWSVAN